MTILKHVYYVIDLYLHWIIHYLYDYCFLHPMYLKFNRSGSFMNKIKFFPFYLISLLPFPIIYLLSNITCFFVYHVLRYRRKVVRRNLKNSFPNKQGFEIKQIEKRFYRHLCDIGFEAIKALTMGQQSIDERFKLKNKKLIDRFYQEGRSVFMYAAHYGNWEWMTFLPLHLHHQVSTFYQPLSNQYFDQLMNIIRSRFGIICTESKKGYKTFLKLNEANIKSLNIIIGDQSPRKNSSKYWTNFLNQETAFLASSDKIVKKSGQPVVFPYFRKLKRGFYELSFTLIEEFPNKNNNQVITDKYANLLEKNIQTCPELWLWSHRRWKLTV